MDEQKTLVKKAPYRALNIHERDTLFAFYEKHNSNMLAMTRDRDCQFKGYAQLKYYCDLYNFHPRYVEIRRKRAEDTIAGLKDSKTLAIQKAVRMLQTQQVALLDRQGKAVLDTEGQPFFMSVEPDHKEIMAAWEIIKTELGEPTTISKAEVTDPKSDEITKALDLIANLTLHGGPQDNGGLVPRERGTAEDTAEIPAPVQHNSKAVAPEE